MIYTSHFEAVTSQEQYTGGVFEFLFGRGNPAYDADRTAIIDAITGQKVRSLVFVFFLWPGKLTPRSRQTSYGLLVEESLRFADGLTRVAGLHRGQTILIFSPNSALYPILVFAAQAAGLVVSTANSSYTATELAHQITLSSADLVLAGADLVLTAKEAIKKADLKESALFVLPDVNGKMPQHLNSFRSYQSLRGEKSFKPVSFTKEQAQNQLAYLPFSSGTTGQAKGVQLSAFNITSCTQQARKTKGLFDEPDTMLAVLPMYHICAFLLSCSSLGLVVVLHLTLYNGGTVVVLPKFDLAQTLDVIQRFKTTAACVVPPLALALAKQPIVDNYDLSSLRFIVSGAAPLSADLQQAVAKRLKGKTLVFQGYGMTETTSIGLIPDTQKELVPGTAGQLLSSMEARLVDADGKDVKVGEAGELWLRGNNIMLGYHRNEKSTRETLTGDGWLMTGDVCERDHDGYYRIVERTKDLIKYKGFQVAPAEVEGVILSSPAVADCAVIGVWSEEQATELPRAYIVPDPKHAKSETLCKDVANWVADKLAPHKRLRGGVIVLETIPKSASGKILRKDLRVMAAQEAESKARL
ncbi:SPOSA6832_02293 [Sporobolomyces salmonicolor]|uniref:SPOSA6832_02293-mRNA-1:cds n=1 Tax=Sporidiobolus salmonicolor TaxID=5005 RepID=A0A0D6EL88_SPOSA|nr:SPOSA6832_02293 [Sporobolomyces salmonicolor]